MNTNAAVKISYTTPLLYCEVNRAVSYIASREGAVAACENELVEAIKENTFSYQEFALWRVSIVMERVVLYKSDTSEGDFNLVWSNGVQVEPVAKRS